MVREVELAENSNLVNEVIDFVNSGLLLSSVKQVVLEDAQIADLDTAKKICVGSGLWGRIFHLV